MTRIEVHAVTSERWPDMVELFERRGPRGGHRNTPAYGCWCMYWRDRSLEHGTPKKRAMARLVRGGREVGLLAYDDGEPIGWISIAPREDYAALLRSPQYRPRDDDEGIWSVVCFAVDRYAQRQGVAATLLGAAVEHASARGAAAVEGYPHVSNGADCMGNRDLFAAHGFGVVRVANKRLVVRRGC